MRHHSGGHITPVQRYWRHLPPRHSIDGVRFHTSHAIDNVVQTLQNQTPGILQNPLDLVGKLGAFGSISHPMIAR